MPLGVSFPCAPRVGVSSGLPPHEGVPTEGSRTPPRGPDHLHVVYSYRVQEGGIPHPQRGIQGCIHPCILCFLLFTYSVQLRKPPESGDLGYIRITSRSSRCKWFEVVVSACSRLCCHGQGGAVQGGIQCTCTACTCSSPSLTLPSTSALPRAYSSIRWTTPL